VWPGPADERPHRANSGSSEATVGDDADMFLGAAQWLDGHRGLIVSTTRFESTPYPRDTAPHRDHGDRLEPTPTSRQRDEIGPRRPLA
jgi:hypothetical protein